MEHIINIAFDFDDAKVKEHIEDTVTKEVIEGIKKDILNSLPRTYSSKSEPSDRLRALLEDLITDFIDHHRDVIYEEVCNRLEKRIMSTKRYKEMKGAE